MMLSLSSPRFDWRGVVSNIRFSITVIALVSMVHASLVEAQDHQVAANLTSYGGISRNEARNLISKVSQQMQKAANSIVGL